ncbi:MAG: hypothetical protein GY749_17455 [Desulfobacteraceae bacterium]|nr:hypothetical protein [Desulfobacteraceae bacterium]
MKSATQILLNGIQHYLCSTTHFFKRWSAIAHYNTLIYICCHADGTNLGLDPYEDKITIDDLRLKLQVAKPYTKNLMFLNGCSTTVGQDGGGFLEATGKEGFYGFIGTEAKIPDIFAVRFGLDFMVSFIYSGKPVYEIMDDLRRRHWPLSLIYGTYCYASLSVSPSPKKNFPLNFDQRNFSFEEVGSNEL